MIPVLITYTVFLFLLSFYSLCYLYPTIVGDYYGTWGIQDYWTSEKDLLADQNKSRYLAVFFGFCALNLLLSLVLTTCTAPGGIPDDREWDQPTGAADLVTTNEASGVSSREDLVNLQIIEGIDHPDAHDFMYLQSSTGPMFQLLQNEEEEE